MHPKMTADVGILAYGSLIADPREEIQNATIAVKKEIMTPFRLEFARASRTRCGAPTLVPVDIGGAQVRGWIFLLDVPEEEAANRLWRRETDAGIRKTRLRIVLLWIVSRISRVLELCFTQKSLPIFPI
jgi:cation transport regulator ChaC